jgi:hypothetical protein
VRENAEGGAFMRCAGGEKERKAEQNCAQGDEPRGIIAVDEVGATMRVQCIWFLRMKK